MLLVTATLKLIIPQSGNILSLLKQLIVSTIVALPLTAVYILKNEAYLPSNLGQYFHRSENIRQRNKRNKQIVILRKLFCILTFGCN